MKLKLITTVTVLLIVPLISLGIISCKSSSTPTTGGSTDTAQVTNNDSYRDQMTTIATELEAVYHDLEQLLINPQIENDDWVYEVAILLADMMELCDQAWQIIPPDSINELEFTFLEAVSHFDDALDVLVKGINEGAHDLINEASTEMWLANEILGQVTKASE